MHFYLHRPHAPGARLPVLCPIQPTAPIRDAITDRTLVEFPTFFALPWAPDRLPAERYLLEGVGWVA